MKMTWEETYKIHTYEVDVNGYLTVPMLSKFMQESASNHAEHLGFGYSNLMEKQLIWVLMGQYIKMEYFPRWNDKISILTRPSIRDRIYFYRDFQIIDDKNSILGTATTKWLSVNAKTRRPNREDMHIGMDWSQYERFCDRMLSKVPPVQEPDTSINIDVNYGDLDVNEHVNQSRYLDWFWQSIPLEHHQNNRIKEIEVIYSSEALYGQKLKLQRKQHDDLSIDFTIIRTIDNKSVCRGKTSWIKRKHT